MRNTAASYSLSLKIAARSFYLACAKFQAILASSDFLFFIKLIIVLQKSDSRTELLDFFSLVTHNDQDVDGRAGGGWSGGSRRGWEANKNLGR